MSEITWTDALLILLLISICALLVYFIIIYERESVVCLKDPARYLWEYKNISCSCWPN